MTLVEPKYFNIEEPERTIDNIVDNIGNPLSVSFVGNDILATRGTFTNRVRICSPTEKYENDECKACSNQSITLGFQ